MMIPAQLVKQTSVVGSLYGFYRTASRVYHSEDTNRVIGIHTEGEFTGQIKKAQSVTPEQLQKLRELKSID